MPKGFKITKQTVEGEHGYWISHPELDEVVGPYDSRAEAKEAVSGLARFLDLVSDSPPKRTRTRRN